MRTTSAVSAVASPTFLQVEPVGQCNLRCRMCAIQYRDDGPSDGSLALLPYDRFVQLVDECERLEEIHLQGLGEPLMHPQFFDLVAYAAGKGIQVTTNSNLTLLRPWLAERCVTSGLAALRVSIDGATKETYERIRVGASFRRVIRNLENIVRTRALLHKTRPQIGLVMVLMRQNLHELPALVRLAHDIGVDEIFVQRLCHDFGESSLPGHYTGMRAFVSTEMLTEEDGPIVERYAEEARDIAEATHVQLRLPRTVPRPRTTAPDASSRCDWPWRGPYISYQGYAMPCCMIGTPDRINFGNTAEGRLHAVWEGEDYSAFRERLASDDPPEICRSCSIYKGTF